MESVTRLLARAWMVGLIVELDGNDLDVTGPRAAGSFIKELKDRKADIVSYLKANGCGALHIRPERWPHRNGKAFCPRCGKYMGHVVISEQSIAMGTVPKLIGGSPPAAAKRSAAACQQIRSQQEIDYEN
jgi:hypothetical protein